MGQSTNIDVLIGLISVKDVNNFFEAVKIGNEADVLNLIRKHSNIVYVVDRYNSTVLHYASKYGYYRICEILLENGASPNAKDDFQSTPLHKAVEGNNYSIYQILLESGANPNIKDEDGDTPLSLLLSSDFIDQQTYEICKLLVVNNADVNAEDKHGYKPLHIMALFDNKSKNLLKCAQLLIDKGADVNAVTANNEDESEETALHIALKKEDVNVEFVKLLIINNADVNAKNKYGNNPMLGLIATKNARYRIKEIKEVIELFIAHGFQCQSDPIMLRMAITRGLTELESILKPKPSTTIQGGNIEGLPLSKKMKRSNN